MEENSGSIQVIEKAVKIIDVLANCQERITLSEVVSLSGIAKSTCFRILNSLKEIGIVAQTQNGQYYLTYKICSISRKILDKTSILSIAKPYIRRLSSSVHSTVNLVVREGDETVYVDRQEDFNAPFKMVSVIGNRRLLHTSAVGKSILAELSDDEVVSYWNRVEKVQVTPYTITSFDKLYTELKQIREAGYSIDAQENTLGVSCVAACFRNYMNHPKYALSISCPSEGFTDEKLNELVPFLLSTKNSIAVAMGTY